MLGTFDICNGDWADNRGLINFSDTLISNDIVEQHRSQLYLSILQMFCWLREAQAKSQLCWRVERNKTCLLNFICKPGRATS